MVLVCVLCGRQGNDWAWVCLNDIFKLRIVGTQGTDFLEWAKSYQIFGFHSNKSSVWQLVKATNCVLSVW